MSARTGPTGHNGYGFGHIAIVDFFPRNGECGVNAGFHDSPSECPGIIVPRPQANGRPVLFQAMCNTLLP